MWQGWENMLLTSHFGGLLWLMEFCCHWQSSKEESADTDDLLLNVFCKTMLKMEYFIRCIVHALKFCFLQ